MEMTNLSNAQSFLFILILSTILTYTTLSDSINVYSQPATMSTMGNATMEQQEHAEHILDNLIISEHIPLKGQLEKGDYVLLMDITPFDTSI